MARELPACPPSGPCGRSGPERTVLPAIASADPDSGLRRGEGCVPFTASGSLAALLEQDNWGSAVYRTKVRCVVSFSAHTC